MRFQIPVLVYHKANIGLIGNEMSLFFGEKELDDITKYEAYYEVLTYVVFSIFNCRTFTQVKVARGKTDVVVFMHDAVYVMELKMRGTAQEALAQIDSKDYAIPY